MKQTFFLAVFSIFLSLTFVQNSSAISLEKTLKQVASDSGKDINAKVDEKLDKIVKKAEGEIDQYKTQIDGEVKKYKAKIDAEEKKIRAIIAETEDAINKIRKIKDNINYYINIVKIIVAVLGSGILVLIFIMWRIWRNIKGMRSLIKNVTNYEDFDKRLKKLEAEIAKSKK